jgi:hypothetical protein
VELSPPVLCLMREYVQPFYGIYISAFGLHSRSIDVHC